MQELKLTLKDEKVRTFRIIAILILFIHLAIFSMQTIRSPFVLLKASFAAGAVFNLMVLVKAFVPGKSRRLNYRLLGICFFLSSLLWLLSADWVPALSSFVMGLFGLRMGKGIGIICNTRGIEWPYFPKRLIPWIEINHVILKDGVLTIEDNRNRVLQALLTAESADSVSEDSFNLFCLTAMASDQSA